MEQFESGKMTKKGQLTIPIEIRELFQMEEEDRLIFEVEDGVVKSIQVKKKSSVERVAGMLHMKG